MHHLPHSFCSFSLCLHNGQMDSVSSAPPNRETLLRTHRPSAQMSSMRMDRDRKSWHSLESSSTHRRSAVRAMVRDAAQHWTVVFLLSLALQPQVSRRLRAIFSRRLTSFDFFFHWFLRRRASAQCWSYFRRGLHEIHAVIK